MLRKVLGTVGNLTIVNKILFTEHTYPLYSIACIRSVFQILSSVWLTDAQ